MEGRSVKERVRQMPNRDIFVVNAGRFNWHTNGELTRHGRNDALEASKELLAAGVEKAVIISGADPSTTSTGEIISKVFGSTVVESDLLAEAGDHVELVGNDLPGFIGDVLSAEGINAPDSAAIILVTHTPLVAATVGRSQLDLLNNPVQPGEVASYDADIWRGRSGALAVQGAMSA